MSFDIDLVMASFEHRAFLRAVHLSEMNLYRPGPDLHGGIDAYLLGTNDSKLTPEMKVLKRRVVSAKGKKDAKKAA